MNLQGEIFFKENMDDYDKVEVKSKRYKFNAVMHCDHDDQSTRLSYFKGYGILLEDLDDLFSQVKDYWLDLPTDANDMDYENDEEEIDCDVIDESANEETEIVTSLLEYFTLNPGEIPWRGRYINTWRITDIRPEYSNLFEIDSTLEYHAVQRNNVLELYICLLATNHSKAIKSTFADNWNRRPGVRTGHYPNIEADMDFVILHKSFPLDESGRIIDAAWDAFINNFPRQLSGEWYASVLKSIHPK